MGVAGRFRVSPAAARCLDIARWPARVACRARPAPPWPSASAGRSGCPPASAPASALYFALPFEPPGTWAALAALAGVAAIFAVAGTHRSAARASSPRRGHRLRLRPGQGPHRTRRRPGPRRRSSAPSPSTAASSRPSCTARASASSSAMSAASASPTRTVPPASASASAPKPRCPRRAAGCTSPPC